MLLGLDIGVSALRTSQQVTNIIGQNLANANNPDYHRQLPIVSAREPVPLYNFLFGSGVEVSHIRQLRDIVIEQAITANRATLTSTGAQLDALNQIQATFGQGEGSLGNLLENFFNQLDKLAAQPNDSTLRSVVLGAARNLTNKFNSLSGDLDAIKLGLNSQVQDIVNNINITTKTIAQLNSQIAIAVGSGIEPNDLRDQRDQLINELAQQISLRAIPAENGMVNVITDGGTLVVGVVANPVNFRVNSADQVELSSGGFKTPLSLTGGQLGGLLQVRNIDLKDYQSRLDELAATFAQRLNAIQTTGVGTAGPYTLLSTENRVRNITVPLNQSGLQVPPQAGTLYVNVTNLTTGDRTLSALTIDPTTQSLQDIATALSSVANIQAVTNAPTGTLQILANPGFAFDFTGRPASSPGVAGITGTTRPILGGVHSVANNDTYTFTVSGSGTVGVTPGLLLNVTNSTGGTVATLNIGQGYSPGSTLTLDDGISLSLSSGTANNGDVFSTPVVGNADSAGLLGSLGLGTFFVGNTAGDIRIRNEVAADPGLLAASRANQKGDTTNLLRLSALRDTFMLKFGSQTPSQFYHALIGDVGAKVNDLGTLKTSQTNLDQQLRSQQQSVSGVDPNEELVNLLSSQHAFEVASKYISVINETLASLVNIL